MIGENPLIKAWVTGNIVQVINLINTNGQLINIMPLFRDPERSDLKIELINHLNRKFGRALALTTWFTLITQDNSITVFSKLVQDRQSELFQMRLTTGCLLHENLQTILAQAPACCWHFCINHNHLVTSELLNSAVRFCCSHPMPEVVSSRILTLWKNPSIKSFDKAIALANLHREELMCQLITPADLDAVLNSNQIINLGPFIRAIFQHIDELHLTEVQQINYLNALALHNESAENVTSIISATMGKFPNHVQRQIWRQLLPNTKDYYQSINWFQIDSKVIPCHLEITETLLEILLVRSNIYDYLEQLTCCWQNGTFHPTLITPFFKCGLLPLNNRLFWQTNSYRHLQALLATWINRLKDKKDQHVVSHVLDVFSRQIGHLLMKDLISYSSELTNYYGPNHPIFELVFRDPSLDAKIPDSVRLHLLSHKIPRINVGFYSRYRHHLSACVTVHKLPVYDPKILELFIQDIVALKMPFPRAIEVLNLIDIYALEDVGARLLSALLSLVESGISERQISVVGHPITPVINPNLIYELQFLLDQGNPQDLGFLEYVAVQHGANSHYLSVQNLLQLHHPPNLLFNKFQSNYHHLIVLYDYYYRTIHQPQLFNVSDSVLLDLLNKNSDLEVAHHMLIQLGKQEYSLDEELISEDVLALHQKYGRLYSNSDLNVCCAICHDPLPNEDYFKAVCGHSFHVACYLQISESCPDCLQENSCLP